MSNFKMIRGINRILENNKIPWKFAENPEDPNHGDDRDYRDYPDYPDYPGDKTKGTNNPWTFSDHQNYPGDKTKGTIPWPFGDGIDKSIISRIGRSCINLFPSDVTGSLHDDFLGICGLGSGNKSLRETFSEMAKWAEAHVSKGSLQELTAVILTDKWNATQYEEHCEYFKSLNIHLVVILCVGEVPVQLPFVYSDLAIEKFIESYPPLNYEQTEAIKHVVRIIRSGHPVVDLGDLNGIDNGVVYWMCQNAFGRARVCNDMLKDLNRFFDK